MENITAALQELQRRMKIKNSALTTCIAELAAKHPQGRALLQAKLGEGAPSAKRRKISV